MWGTTNCVSISFRAEMTVITANEEIVAVRKKNKNESIVWSKVLFTRATNGTVFFQIMLHSVIVRSRYVYNMFNANRKSRARHYHCIEETILFSVKHVYDNILVNV